MTNRESNAIEISYAASDTRGQRAHWLGNIRKNLQVIRNSAEVGRLAGLLKGVPGIAVGAGPSLEKNGALLAEVQRNYPLFCSDRALRRVGEYGITPQFVVVCDAQDRVVDFLKDYDTGGIVLLATTFASPKVLALPWKQRVFFNMLDLDTKFSEASMNLTQHRVGMIPGTVIVGNACFLLAKLAGCNPVTFVGNDLSMPDREMALPGERLYEGKDPEGRTVYSVPGYLAGLDWLLRYLRADVDCVQKRVRVYNSTEGGIMYSEEIEGMPLREFVEKFPGMEGSVRTKIMQGLF
ncbi:MAG: 6-hydroxymethylpterin diphosphokinase MptE-like protein [bacterium]